MGVARVNGVSLYVEEHGTGQAILGIHGTGSSAWLWQGAVPELSRRGRLILYDRRGCTRSERPGSYETTGVAQHAADALSLLDALNARSAVLIGRSYGGEVAVQVAVQEPEAVRALILLEPTMPLLTPESRAWLETLREQIAAAGPEAAAELLVRAALGDETWSALPVEVREMFLENGPAIAAEVNGQWSEPDPASLAALAQPVLLVSAADSPPDFRAADDALARLLPQARREVIGGGHLIDAAHPVVLSFLDDVLG